MKTRNLQSLLLVIAAVAAFAFTADNVAAQEPTTAVAQPEAASQPAPQLSYGVPQVMQLAQAKVSDGIIVSYIQNSGTIYGLKADEIVYLKQQGVSDTVLNAMMNQRSRLTGSTEPATTTASAPANEQTYATVAPATTYVQSVPSSTVYIIPDTQTYRYNALYYGGYPYPYYGYYPYRNYGYYPGVTFSFGFGDRWGGFHDRDGRFRSGGFHTEGFRGGGGWHSSGGWHR